MRLWSTKQTLNSYNDYRNRILWNIPFYKTAMHMSMLHRDSESVLFPLPAQNLRNESCFQHHGANHQSLSESIFHDTYLIIEIDIGTCIQFVMNRKEKPLVYFPIVIPFFSSLIFILLVSEALFYNRKSQTLSA